jgi:hypothetical protein
MLYKDDVPHIEVGVQVTGSFAPAGDVVASTLPGGLAATATYTGPIAKIGDTHQAVCEWSKARIPLPRVSAHSASLKARAKALVAP